MRVPSVGRRGGQLDGARVRGAEDLGGHHGDLVAGVVRANQPVSVLTSFTRAPSTETMALSRSMSACCAGELGTTSPKILAVLLPKHGESLPYRFPTLSARVTAV